MKNRRQLEVSEAELAALADGSLAPECREEVEARIAACPELQAKLAEQKRARALVAGAVAGVRAPADLRARVKAWRRARRSARH